MVDRGIHAKWRANRNRKPKVLARQSKWLNKKIKSVVRRQAETKTRSSSHEETTMNTLTNNFRDHTPCRIATGDEVNERIGNEVTLTGIDIRGYVHNNSTTDTVHVRAMAIIDKEKNGQNTDLSALLIRANVPVDIAGIGSLASVLRPNTKRYRVLWDTVYTLSAKASGNGSSHTRMFKRYLKTDLKLKYGDRTDGSITQNDVKIVFFCCEADGDVNLGETVELYSQCTGYYKDM